MNRALNRPEVQRFIEEHYMEDLGKIVFAGSPFENIKVQELAQQLAGKKIAEKKLPTWFATSGIQYPPKINLEQTSSEATAAYKANLFTGGLAIDLTGGFGVDSFFFSKVFNQVAHCEENQSLSEMARSNFRRLGADNITCIFTDGLAYLEREQGMWDLIYVDPSRRSIHGEKRYHLSDCFPDVPQNLEILLRRGRQLLIKTSPLLDIRAGLKELRFAKEIHVVAHANEVKELLWLIEPKFKGKTTIKTVNLLPSGSSCFEAELDTAEEERYSQPRKYLYEPNAALMKAGLFGSLCHGFKLEKLHPNSHLFTSEELIDFPGRTFEVIEVIPYKKKAVKKLNIAKANIAVRNFPETVLEIRKKFGIKDGGQHYLFFTTLESNEKVVISCLKT